MSTVLWSDFLPEVIPYVPEVPSFVAENAVRNACIEFCERSRFWQEDLDPTPVVAGMSSYQIDVPTGAKFVEVSEAWLDGNLIIPKTAEELTRIYRGTDWRSMKGAPAYMTRLIPTEVMLVPTPKVSGSKLRLRASYAPTRASTGVGSMVYEEYLEVIAAGARSRLYSTPKQPYFDQRSAEVYAKVFRMGISEARIRVNRGMTRSATQIEFQRVI